MAHDHPLQTNFIVQYLPDNWVLPAGYDAGNIDQSGTYSTIDNQTADTAEDAGYSTAHVYPVWLTIHCLNLPNASHAEIDSLHKAYGPSGSAYFTAPV